MAQMLRGTSAGARDAAQGGDDHVAIFERGDEARALFRIVAQPVQKLGETPLGGVDAAAPVDGFELLPVRGSGNLLRLAPGAMIAP